jgi:hypothetical protein
VEGGKPSGCRKTGRDPQLRQRPLLSLRRYPPTPFYTPLQFYSSVRLGDPEQLAKIMDTDPFFITQDNGAGAPLHFATTYRQLDMVRRWHPRGAAVAGGPAVAAVPADQRSRVGLLHAGTAAPLHVAANTPSSRCTIC